MKIFVAILILLFVGGVVFSACSWTSGSQEGLVFPEENISYLLHVKPFLEQNCSYSPCHSYANFAGGICLIEYHQVIAVANFIIPANPDVSRFVQILEEKGVPHYTYFYRKNITENHTKGVRQWIKEGAINQ
ncbi:MAG: hypothetical protein FWG85_04020 [Bacteroidetes bacterium]|nr:hypothetical protein [Bacteroidota bacterium]